MRPSSKPLRRTGALRHRLAIEAPIRADDGGGGANLSWSVVADVWAAIRPLLVGEKIAGETLQANVTHLVVLRSIDGIGPEMRFRYGARTLQIVGIIDDDERRAWLECYCAEKDP